MAPVVTTSKLYWEWTNCQQVRQRMKPFWKRKNVKHGWKERKNLIKCNLNLVNVNALKNCIHFIFVWRRKTMLLMQFMNTMNTILIAHTTMKWICLFTRATSENFLLMKTALVWFWCYQFHDYDERRNDMTILIATNFHKFVPLHLKMLQIGKSVW